MTSGVIGTAASHIQTTSNAVFIPELWSDDVIAAYKTNLVLANYVTKINHQGKKGDTLHIPVPTRGSAVAKVAETQVKVQSFVETQVNISIDQHYEYSRIIEDIVGVQAIDSYRAFYTDDAGFALATQVDDALFAQAESLQGGTVGGTGAALWEKAVIGGDGATLYTGDASNDTAITDVGIRRMIQTLDDADVPQMNRALIIPPVERNVLMGLARFSEQAFTGEAGPNNVIRNGKIGDIYGIEVVVTSNCPSIDSAATRIGLLLHKDALVFVEQMAVRSQTQYKQEWLGDLFTADTIYGVGELRDNAGIAFAVPA
jgi:HK97 family phage major capsid protein